MHNFPNLPRPDLIAVRIPEAVKITGLSRSALYELIKRNEVEVAKIGRATLLPVASLHALIEKNIKKAA